MSAAPAHLLMGPREHGVTRHAAQVADAVGAEVVSLDDLARRPRQRVHVHVTDRLFGATAELATVRLLDLVRRHDVSATLHDVPQPAEGAVFERRRHPYAAVLAHASGWVVSSRHEASLVQRHLAPATRPAVIPLPVLPLATAASSSPHAPLPVVGVLGWVYPGKGHEQVLRACARLGHEVEVRALGAVADGCAWLDRHLGELAEALGVRWQVTGWIADADLPTALAAVDVPVAAHHHVSASGSVNTWLAARRRPLVSESRYVHEMAALRPETLTVVAPGEMADAMRAALATPDLTRLGPWVDTSPGLAAVAGAYRRWWCS